MVGHDFLCPSCSNIFYSTVRKDEFGGGVFRSCPECGQPSTITYTKPPGGDSPALDNKYYNPRGHWDPNLKEWVYTRKQEDELLKAKGMRRVEDFDELTQEYKYKERTEEQVRDRWERAKGMVSQGWKPEEPTGKLKELADARREEELKLGQEAEKITVRSG